MTSARQIATKTALSTIALTFGFASAAVAAPASGVQRGALILDASVPAPRSVTVLHSFNGADGSAPVGNLELAVGRSGNTLNRTIYGITEGGGTGLAGSIFADVLGPNTFSSIYSFTGGNDGGTPAAGLAANEFNYFLAGGFQLGVAINGGADGDGTLFAVSANGAVTVLHTFTGGADGASPAGRLTQFTDGNYYGTTSSGGAGFGTIFKLTPSGKFSTIYTFTGGDDGGAPEAGLSLNVSAFGNANVAGGSLADAVSGKYKQYVSPYLYGTTSTAGSGGVGTIFRTTPAGALQVVYTFSGGNDGGVPAAKLITDLQGDLYGSTTVGGVDGNGVIFKLKATTAAAPSYAVIYDFGNGATGASPQAALTLAFDGNLYGTTTGGGASGQYGSVFEITRRGRFYDIHDFASTDGANPQGALVDGGDGKLYGTTLNGGAFGQGEIFSIAE